MVLSFSLSILKKILSILSGFLSELLRRLFRIQLEKQLFKGG